MSFCVMFVPGLVVASVCYLQFFPAPSDEKGIDVPVLRCSLQAKNETHALT